jgi:hypothetical protein
MEKVCINGFLVTFLFCLFKIFEMKYVDKEWKPLKIIVREAIIVFVCASMASFIFFHLEDSISDFLNVVTQSKSFNPNATQIFTDAPDF